MDRAVGGFPLEKERVRNGGGAWIRWNELELKVVDFWVLSKEQGNMGGLCCRHSRGGSDQGDQAVLGGGGGEGGSEAEEGGQVAHSGAWEYSYVRKKRLCLRIC